MLTGQPATMADLSHPPVEGALAACHSCCLVLETACEEFNRFLDHALVVGTHDDPTVGFF